MSELCVRTPYSITRNREIPTMPWHQSSFCQGNPSFTPRSGNQILYCVIGAVYLKTISRQLKQVYSVETSISFFFREGGGLVRKNRTREIITNTEYPYISLCKLHSGIGVTHSISLHLRLLQNRVGIYVVAWRVRHDLFESSNGVESWGLAS